MTEIPLEHVHLEAETPNDGPAPAVFIMHGRGANEQDLLPIADELPDKLAVISFRAPDRLQGGYTWYDLDLSGGGLHESQPDAGGFRRSLDLVTESIAVAVEAYNLDPDRLGLLGFSQGSIMSLALLLESPDQFAWVAALHGYLADSHADLNPDEIGGTPVFVAAGRGDQIIPHTRGEAAADRLRSIGADVTLGVYDGGHGIGPKELTDLVEFVTTALEA